MLSSCCSYTQARSSLSTHTPHISIHGSPRYTAIKITCKSGSSTRLSLHGASVLTCAGMTHVWLTTVHITSPPSCLRLSLQSKYSTQSSYISASRAWIASGDKSGYTPPPIGPRTRTSVELCCSSSTGTHLADGIQRTYDGAWWMGPKLRQVTAASQSKASNVWI
jgi:hypothetical protein